MISRVKTTQWVKRIATETELNPGTHTVERENQLPPVSCPPASTCVPWYTHSCALTHSWVAKYIFKEVLLPPVILDPSFPLRSHPQTQTSSPGMARPPSIPSQGSWCPTPILPSPGNLTHPSDVCGHFSSTAPSRAPLGSPLRPWQVSATPSHGTSSLIFVWEATVLSVLTSWTASSTQQEIVPLCPAHS